jgi:23S rRNA (cytosine1962-C5)-methyltransferase
MENKVVILHKNKDKAIRNRHHWIFSGAIKRLPPGFENGSILPVHSFEGEHLGYAYFNQKCSVAGRMLSFDETPPLEAVKKNIEDAITLRAQLFNEKTNAFRLINGEGDNLPGLVVDRYADVLVVQIATLGMEKLKPLLVEILTDKFSPRCIYEKSNLPSRREEGLADFEGLLAGKTTDIVEVSEDGVCFLIKLVGSQKTGFFLDQREMRKLVRSHSAGKRVLDCFSYTGGFSVYALAGGAVHVDLVDTSEKALVLARQNLKLNGFESASSQFYAADVFDFLRQKELTYDFIILDPPAFAKKKTDVKQACRGYKDINRLVFQKIPARSLVLTFSCSFFVDESLFQKVIFQAAKDAKRNVRIIQRHHLAYDHPISVFHPESSYLKGFLLYVD